MKLSNTTKQILVYGDSLSWGIIPDTRKRLPLDQRWPGVLENQLNADGRDVRVVENCVNGRRTVWEDPFKPGRNGLTGLATFIESQSPLALVILLLGVNDLQFSHPFNNAWSAAQGVAVLINEIRKAPIEPGMPIPLILVVCPPAISSPKGTIAPKFFGARERSAGMATAYSEMATNLNCCFFDAGSVVSISKADGIHLDADQHLKLGVALAEVVSQIFWNS